LAHNDFKFRHANSDACDVERPGRYCALAQAGPEAAEFENEINKGSFRNPP
jgi:hypothetical protein